MTKKIVDGMMIFIKIRCNYIVKYSNPEKTAAIGFF